MSLRRCGRFSAFRLLPPTLLLPRPYHRPPPPEPTRTDLSLPIDPPPPTAVPTADSSTTESLRPPPPAPVDRTMEQPQIAESQLPASLLIPVGETPPLPEDPDTWADIL